MPDVKEDTLLGVATPLFELPNSEAEIRAELEEYAEMGVKWLRLDFYWGHIQYNPNQSPNYWKLDTITDIADELGIDIIGILLGYQDGISRGYTTEQDRQKFADFAEDTVSHFGDKVDVWEILNEPNINDVSPTVYADLLKKSYTAIKNVDPDTFILFAGNASVPYTTNGLWGAVEYLETVYQLIGPGYFDALSYHPYSYPLMPDNPASYNGWQMMESGIRDTMIKWGDEDLKVWITEMGAPTEGGNAVTQDGLITTLQQAVEMALAYDWVGPLTWYSHQDRGGDTSDRENYFGLKHPDGTPKPAYDVFKDLAYMAIELAGEDAVLPPEGGDDDQILFEGDDGDDVLVGNDLDNILLGEGGNDQIVGGAGNDTLTGGAGNDQLTGGAGDDVFAIFENPGYDKITDFSAGDRISFVGLDGDTAQAGLQGFEFIGGNWLTEAGQIGAYVDAAAGRTYVQARISEDAADDVIVILEGVHSLSEEDLILAIAEPEPEPEPEPGPGTILGTDASETLSGGSTDDTIDGGAGSDTVTGGGGDDLFVISTRDGIDLITDFSDGDKISLAELDADTTASGQQEFAFIGGDWLSGAGELGVYTSVAQNKTYIQARVSDNPAEDLRLELQGVHDLDESDFILSSPADGLVLTGTDAAETLQGSDGSDTITGAGGNDVLTGGAGDDTFVFQSGDGVDIITDYEAGDLISLAGIDANESIDGDQAFAFIGGAWLEAAGQVGVYVSASQDRTYIEARTDDDGTSDVKIILEGQHDIALSDLVL